MKSPVFLLIFFPITVYAQVRYTAEGDTLKGNIQEMIEKRDEYQRIVYTSNLAMKTETITSYANDSVLMWQQWLQLDDACNVVEKRFISDHDSLTSRIICTYDPNGRKIKEYRVSYPYHGTDWREGNAVTFRDSSANLVESKFDTAGRLIERKEDEVTDGLHQMELKTIKYDGAGREMETKTERQYRQPHLETTTCTYDERGRRVTEIYLAKDSDEFFNNFFCDDREVTLKTTKKYDDANNLIEITTQMNAKRRWHSGVQIGHTYRYTYDAYGNETSQIAYDTYREDDGSITRENSCIHTAPRRADNGIRRGYDNYGNIVKQFKNNEVVFSRKITYY